MVLVDCRHPLSAMPTQLKPCCCCCYSCRPGWWTSSCASQSGEKLLLHNGNPCRPAALAHSPRMCKPVTTGREGQSRSRPSRSSALAQVHGVDHEVKRRGCGGTRLLSVCCSSGCYEGQGWPYAREMVDDGGFTRRFASGEEEEGGRLVKRQKVPAPPTTSLPTAREGAGREGEGQAREQWKAPAAHSTAFHLLQYYQP